jgi:NADH dehydrogenase [ubiquinone] 1 alpha subcomplex assembly factor 6
MGIRDINADHAASHIGKALGLMTIIKALPYNARVRQLNLPMDVTVRVRAILLLNVLIRQFSAVCVVLLRQHGLVTEDVFKGEFTQPLHEAVYEVANLAKTHLDMGREMKSQLKYPAQVALLPAVRHESSRFLFHGPI